MKNMDGLSATIGALLQEHLSLDAAVAEYSGGRIILRGEKSRVSFLEGKIKEAGYSCLEYIWFLTKEGCMTVPEYPELRNIYGDPHLTRKRSRDDLLVKPNAWVSNPILFASFVDFKERQMETLQVSQRSICSTANDLLATSPENLREMLLLNNYKDYRMHGLDLYIYHERIIHPLKWFEKYNRELARLFFLCNPEYLRIGFALQEALDNNKYELRDWLSHG